MAEPALTIADLCVTLHRDGQPVRVLDGLNLTLAPGEIVALVGESGSGKSTLGVALQGLLPEDAAPLVSGSIRVAGTELVGATPRDLRNARRALVRAIQQDPMAGLNPTMTIGRQLAESARDVDGREWLARTGLDDPARIAAAYPHRLSGGQRQRVLIAMAMMARPRLLVADEPTTALDVTTRAQILEMLRGLAAEQQTAILFVTHDLGVAAALADRIAVLHAGRIVEIGTTRAFVASAQHPYSRRLLAASPDLNSDRSPLGGETAWPPVQPGPSLALSLAGVNKSYPTGTPTFWGSRRAEPVLKSIDLSIRMGECVALVGESGVGKSTILRIAAGLVSPDSGEVSRADRRPQVVFQDPAAALTPWLSIGAQIGDRVVDRTERPGKVRHALELVGLDPALATALPAELSLGQCQRAVLARAVVVPPKLLLCDEPTSAMDAPLAAAILNLLGDLRRRLGTAMLFVTHDLAAARRVADRIAVLKDGRLVETANPQTLVAAPASGHTRSLIAGVPGLAGAR